MTKLADNQPVSLAAFVSTLDKYGWPNEVSESGNHVTFNIACRGDRNPSGRAAFKADGEFVIWDTTGQTSQKDICKALGFKITHRLWGEDEPLWFMLKDGYKLAKTYLYLDRGKPVRRVLRYEKSGEPKRIIQQRPIENEMWENTTEGVPWSLYEIDRVRHARPQQPIYIVEGEKCVDAIIRSGQVATCSPCGAGKWPKVRDYARKELKGHNVVVIADNDDPGRKHASEVAESMLGVAGSIRVIWSLPDVEEKGDVVDWLDAGHTIEELSALGSDYHGQSQYEARHDGLYHVWFDKKGERCEQKLSNFTARIIESCKHITAGVSTTENYLTLECCYDDKTTSLEMPYEQFLRGEWYIGIHPKASIEPIARIKDIVRAAVQATSPADQIKNVSVYKSLGLHDDLFVHSGGAIGPDGHIPARVNVPQQFASYDLTPTELEPVECLEATLRCIKVADVAYVLLGAIFRAPLSGSRLSIDVFGPTGTFKTSVVQALLGHYGRDHNEENIPFNADSTVNALIGACQIAGQLPVLVDEIVPRGGQYEQQKLKQLVEQLRSAVGNMGSRNRMSRDAKLREQPKLDCVLITTGEDAIGRESTLARSVQLPFARGTIDTDALSQTQADRENGLLVGTMFHFIWWIAVNKKRDWATRRAKELRSSCTLPGHARNRSNWAQLIVGWEALAEYAKFEGVEIDIERAKAVITRVCTEQADQVEEARPVPAFFSAIRDALTAGHGHLRNKDGDIRPTLNEEICGWRDGQEQGELVGWIVGDEIWLLPRAARDVAQKVNPDLISTNALATALKDSDLLVRTGRKKIASRERVRGVQRHVWIIRLKDIIDYEPEASPCLRMQNTQF